MQQLEKKLIAAVLILLVLVGIYFSGVINNRKAGNTNPAKMKLDDYIPYLIKETTGGIIDFGSDTLLSYKVNSDMLLLKLHANESYSEKKTQRKINQSSIKILKKFFIDREDIKKVVLNWYLELPDSRGERKLRKVLALVMTKEEAVTVNWNSLTAYDLSNTVAGYWIHPILKAD
ncbi:hypothetical protein [Acetohalobium arabaticum]|uniref:DUF4825 domain-containing protein n=1 Tax=Acetohalobium arabaticum (strain ATCC 49924 / DSM 5501 / Z-7288) TaxID=574087 RepID=D9QR68_ACEAZ|nr:hypothetical protein [Acetohalobium arabaticum]ADL13009.1 hypothetical protein Acear_1501 [Acetohalobium arabaticum DSM 5501]